MSKITNSLAKKAIVALLSVSILANSVVTAFGAGNYDDFDVKTESIAVAEAIQSEGTVLLKNDNNALPLAKNSKVNFFGVAAGWPVLDGGGSGSINVPTNDPFSGEPFYTQYVSSGSGMSANRAYRIDQLYDTLKNDYGIEANQRLLDFYEEWYLINYNENAYNTSVQKDADEGNIFGTAAAMKAEMPFEQLLDPSLGLRKPTAVMDDGKIDFTYGDVKSGASYSEDYSNIWQNAQDYSDTAVVVIGRKGSESADLSEFELQLRQSEKDLIKNCTENFDKVIVIYNTCNTMEMSELEEYDVDAALMIWAVGEAGLHSVAGILAGEINPSGRLVDTITYNIADHPSSENFGSFQYTNISDTRSNKFLQYEEGIYVGYRYFETFGATDKVQYPFGYGLSYTSFNQEIVGDIVDNGDSITMQVKVTNTGDVAGKDVVQIYSNPPYSARYGIEMAKYNLVGYAKTDTLVANGGEETVKITIDKYDMASYDMNGSECYVLLQGNYTLSVMSSMHSASIDNAVIGTKTFTQSTEIEYKQDPVTGTTVENQFEDAVLGGTDGGAITVLSRANAAATYPTAPTGDDFTAAADLTSRQNVYPAATTEGTAFEFGVSLDETIMLDDIYIDAALQLNLGNYDNMEDAIWESSLWNYFISQFSLEDAYRLIGTGGYQTAAVDAFGVPATVDNDGPQQIKGRGTGNNGSGVAYPVGTCVACTWNTELSYDMGVRVGVDGAAVGVQSWYAPGTNIHRSLLGGRNFEYYSEDPFISGETVAQVIAGCKSENLAVTVKHFALNDCEANRSGVNTWADEQTIREIYLKPFEKAIKQGGAIGVMSSFNRIGSQWAGGDVGLITNVLREEWGFRGYVVTDYWSSSGNYMSPVLAVYAQNDTLLSTNATSTVRTNISAYLASDPIGMSNAIARSVKNLCYFKMFTLAFNEPSTANTFLREELQKWYDVMLEKQSSDEYSNIPTSAKQAYDSYLDAIYLVLQNDYATDAELIQAIAWTGEALDLLGLQLGDMTVLGALIAEYEKIDLANYRTDGQEEFLSTLAKANEMYNSGEAFDEDIQDMISNLISDRNALRLRANTEALEAALQKAQALVLSEYTDESVENSNIVTLMAQAAILLENVDAEETAITTLAADINSAIDTLVKNTNAGDNNTDGSSTDGSSIDGSSTDGSSIDGSSTDGSSIDGSSTDGSSIDGSSTDGSSTDGSSTDGSSTDGSSTDGSSTDGSSTNGCNTDGSSTGKASKLSVAKTGDTSPMFAVLILIVIFGIGFVLNRSKKRPY